MKKRQSLDDTGFYKKVFSVCHCKSHCANSCDQNCCSIVCSCNCHGGNEHIWTRYLTKAVNQSRIWAEKDHMPYEIIWAIDARLYELEKNSNASKVSFLSNPLRLLLGGLPGSH